MTARTFVVGIAGGLHARSAARLVAAVTAQPLRVTIRVGQGPAVPADSILSILALGAGYGTAVTVEVHGEGATALLDDLAALLTCDIDQACA